MAYGNSPYQPYSSHAMDELYISIDGLIEDGLIESAPTMNEMATQVDYEKVREFKQAIYHQAFAKFKPDAEYQSFIKNEWVYPFAVFMTLKKKNHFKEWNRWPYVEQQWIKDHEFDLSGYRKAIEYEMFLQYELFRQWKKLKHYANDKGIEIMGDLPIYVGYDSVDVWRSQQSFLLDDKSRPTFIAGVPPDYFSETGQRWGNPIYDWEYLEKNNFEFWIDRLAYNMKMFDCIRIDHFRAFDTYWKIKADCPTAIDGTWEEAPGYALFDTIFKEIPDAKIVAEDLGNMRPEVYELRDHYHFKGMKIVQFTFDPTRESDFEDRENMIVYTGTHDNQTIRSWYQGQDPLKRTAMREYLNKAGYRSRRMSENFIAYAMDNMAEWAIIPMQDILNLNDEARMNEPGTIGSPNWQWKMATLKPFANRVDFFRKIVKKAKR